MSIIGSNILAGASGQAGYNLNNSLRFRESASPYLSRTPASASNRQIWTWSGWVKRGSLSAYGFVLQAGATSTTNGNTLFGLGDNGSAYISFYSTVSHVYETAALFRDPSAWYHIVFALDTTQATAANRVKMYVNGVQITVSVVSGYTDVPQNFNCAVNNTVIHVNGAYRNGAGNLVLFYDGYQTEINFIDGQALTPSSFGETSLTTGSWIPKKYTGTYGTNGFYLKFADASAATAAAIGKDSSGNGNNWTPSGISVTAGVTYDAMLDVPTNTSATVGNYCVLNSASIGADATLSNANLTIAYGSAATRNVTMGTLGLSSGKWYWECSIITASAGSPAIGITNTASASEVSNYPGFAANGWGYLSDGNKYNNGSGVAYGATFTTSDIIGIAFDADTGSITFYKNNTSQGVAFSSLAAGTYFPAFGDGGGSGTWSGAVNFGQRPFTYTPPTGFVALNTFNLPTPTILQGNKYMDATLYTGAGNTSTSITNASGFKPDFVWTKVRSTTYNHYLYDSVRGTGTGASLVSNLTDAEGSNATNANLSSFNSNGWTIGTTSATNAMNASGQTFVGWQWQAGQGSTSSNTSGTITSTVSVNATAGFSVVTYTGNATNGATVGHGLGVAPKMIIGKIRSTTGDWWTWQTTMGDNVMKLNTTAAQVPSTANSVYNTASFSSTVFALGSGSSMNASGGTYVAYCWAEIAGFSKFGSYTGNGSADGPFVYLGFRPKYVLVKGSSAGGTNYDWYVLDSSRDTYNLATNFLCPDLSQAEATGVNKDFLSNGFKIRGTTTGTNTNGVTYIYMAFAESPFKTSNSR